MKSKVCMIVNPGSRSGKSVETCTMAEQVLKNRKIPYTVLFTQKRWDAARFAKKFCEEANAAGEICNLIVLGGDGTINEAINGIPDFTKVRFGVVASGSGNDFGRGLKIEGTPKEQIRYILDDLKEGAAPDWIDLGKVTYDKGQGSRYYAISSGFGLDAEITRRVNLSSLKSTLNKLKLGKFVYFIVTIQALFDMTTTRMYVQRGDSHGIFSKAIFLAAMNFFGEGGGIPMAPDADPRDGKLSVCMVHGVPKWKTFFILPILALGKHKRLHGVQLFSDKEFTVQADHPLVLHTDGEHVCDTMEVQFSCVPHALPVIGLRGEKR
ncbi:MAG: diacylglycerol kinase family lipid kinase [Firmicutes bacterium]|nr:diacylglycerol kinase family lipid kinase [Bacillota bacterium]